LWVTITKAKESGIFETGKILGEIFLLIFQAGSFCYHIYASIAGKNRQAKMP